MFVMILSHKHRFIFLKTRKTAGTSIELGLCNFCGKEDIITQEGIKDEALRKSLGYIGPQNNTVNIFKHRLVEIARIPIQGFANHKRHDPGWLVKKHIGKEIFDSYHKITAIRNPWDMAVSRFYFRRQLIGSEVNENTTFKEYLRITPKNDLDNSRVYRINEKSVVDSYVRFENLLEDWKGLLNKLNLDYIDLPKAKTGIRKDKEHYSLLYDDDDIEIIRNLCTWEINEFGYEFEDYR